MESQIPEIESLLPCRTHKRNPNGEVAQESDGNEELEISTSELGLRRSLSLIDGISLLVGIIIGSGIFTSPGVVLKDSGSVGLGLTAWVAAAFMALCSALVYAELGAAIPHAGGNAEFFKVAFGDVLAFSFIWTMFFVLTNGSLAIVAITFSRYMVAGLTGLSSLEGDMDSDPVIKAVAIGCVAALTIWNCFGVHVAAGLQNLINVMKMLLISLLVVAAVVFLWGNPYVLERNFSTPFAESTFSGFGVSCVAALWAFSGCISFSPVFFDMDQAIWIGRTERVGQAQTTMEWTSNYVVYLQTVLSRITKRIDKRSPGDLVFLTEELKDPERDIPRGTVGSISLVVIIYLIMNVIYLCILPAAVVKTSAVVAIDATSLALGPWAGSFTAILVAISLLGSANGIIICGARYLYAAGRQGQISKLIGTVGKQSRAPYVAHLLQGILCILLLLQSSKFVELVSFFGVASFVFYGLTGLAHMKIRHDFPTLHRPYTVAFYPYAPLIVICFSLYLVVSSGVAQPFPTSLSLGFILISFPVYYLFVRQPQT